MQERVLDDGDLYIEIVEMSLLFCMNENVANVGHVYGDRATSRLGRRFRRGLFAGA